MRGRADPVIALAMIRAAQVELGKRVDRRGIAPSAQDMPVVVDLAAAVADARRHGERRDIHRRPYRRTKPIPKRPSMFEPYRAEIEVWLDAEPAMTAVDVLAGLDDRHPSRFTNTHLRTLQRLVKAWRAGQAAKIVHHGTATLTLVPAAETIPPAHDPPIALGSILG